MPKRSRARCSMSGAEGDGPLQGDAVMTSAVKTRRNQMISSTVDRIRLIEKDKGVTREALEDIRAIMLELAASTELFPEEDFVIEKDDKGNYPIYRLAEDDDHRFALYMSTSIGAKDVPPHDHTTWAVIVSVQGTEENRFYEKIGDYSVSGQGQLHITPYGRTMTLDPRTPWSRRGIWDTQSSASCLDIPPGIWPHQWRHQ